MKNELALLDFEQRSYFAMENKRLTVSDPLHKWEGEQIEDIVRQYMQAGYKLWVTKEDRYDFNVHDDLRHGVKFSDFLRTSRQTYEHRRRRVKPETYVMVMFDVKVWSLVPRPIDNAEISITAEPTFDKNMKKIDKLIIGTDKFFQLANFIRSYRGKFTDADIYRKMINSTCGLTISCVADSLADVFNKERDYWNSYLQGLQVETTESGIKYVPELMKVIDVTEPFHEDQLICPVMKEVQVRGDDIYHVKVSMTVEQFAKSGKDLLEYLG